MIAVKHLKVPQLLLCNRTIVEKCKCIKILLLLLVHLFGGLYNCIISPLSFPFPTLPYILSVFSFIFMACFPLILLTQTQPGGHPWQEHLGHHFPENHFNMFSC